MNASILFQGHPDPMWFHDPETRRMLAVNDAAARIYGHNVAEDGDLCLLGPCPKTEERRLTNMLRHLDPFMGDLGLWQLTRHDGVAIHSAIHAQHLDFEGKPAILVCARDVSAFLALETRRRDVMGAPQYESVLFETFPGSVIVPGPGQFMVVKPETFRIVEICDDYLAQMHLTREAVIGTLLFDLYFNAALAPEPIADFGAADALRQAFNRVHKNGRAEVVTVQRRPPLPGQDDSLQQQYWGTLISPVKSSSGRVDLLVLRTDDISHAVLDTLLLNAQNQGQGSLEAQAALDMLAVAEKKLRAAEQLTRSEAALRDAQRIGNIGSWELDRATGWLEWSDQVYAIVGLERAEFPNTFEAFLQRVHPADRQRLKDARAASFEAGEKLDITFRIIRPDGSVRVVREIEDVDPDRAPLQFSGVIQDVTALHVAETQARDASTLLRIAGRTAHLGAWRLTLEDGLIVWSDETAAIHEGPVPEFPTVENWISYFAQEHRPVIRAALRACAEDGQSFDLISEFITARGNTRWVRSTGEAERDARDRIIAINGALQDITELVTMRKRAEDSEKLMDLAGRAVRLGGWRVSLVDQTVSWTDGIAAIHELPPGTQPTFESGIDYFAPEEQEDARKVFEACARDGIAFDNVRDLITAKGNRIKVRSMGEPVRDAAGTIIAVRGAMQDISELTAAQQKAAELSTRLMETLENIGDAFFTLDRDWRFTYLNSRAEILLERQRDRLIGCKLFDEFPEAIGTEFETMYIRAFETGQTVRFEQFFVPLERTFRISAHPTPNGLAVYFTDISDDRRRDEHLRLLDAAVARINDIVMITEAGRVDAPDSPRIVYVNDAFERFTGYTRDEVIGQTPRILQGPKTQRDELDRIRKALDTFAPVRAELINYAKSGQEYWLEIDIVPIANEAGVFTHFVAIERDITDRRLAEEALRISEARFRLIARASGNSVWEWDISGGEWWNDGLAAIFGHQPDPDTTPLSVWRANISRDDEPRFDEAMDGLLSGETDAMVVQYQFRRADGSWASVEDRAFAIRDDEGRAIRVLGSMTDISERLQMEDRLRQSQKLEAIGQLTGGVAHDFNNLLTIIMGNTEFLQDELGPGHPLRKYADMSAMAADRAAELTRRLLAFSRKQALQPQVIDLNAVIAGIEGMLRRTLGADIDIEIVRAGGLWRTEADIGQLEAALLNLTINARDAMPDGGSLTIETANASLDDAYVATEPGLKSGQYVVIAVSDTGHGIPRDQMDRVFEPFFTTKAIGKGTGLGLSMVYGFVKQTGGHITIYSEPDQGTTVKLYFPRFQGEKTASGLGSEASPMLRGEETILVVEDDTLILQQLKAQLEGLGYTVITASAGAPALAILRERSDIDLLFTDVVLPGGMNGRQLADAVRKIRPDLKVLYTSGYSQNAIVHHGRLDRGVELLSKPYRRSALASKVRQVLES